MGIINFAKPVTGNVFADIMLWLVNLTSVVGGVILFTLLLKLVTFPFDYFSRASMRKNSVLMEQMRPELEKLQRQYADNKNLYNQKMMALYKKNGYSMFGACLPTILTLVIFIIAINGFTAYSQFQNRQYFYDMSVSYNNVVYAGMDIDDNYIVRTEEGKIVIKDQDLYNEAVNTGSCVLSIDKDNDGNNDFDIMVSIVNFTLRVETTNSYVIYERAFSESAEGRVFGDIKYYATADLKTNVLASEENNSLKVNGKTFSEWKAENTDKTFENFVNEIQTIKSAERFRADKASFLWVSNVWVSDSPMAHPVESNWDTFKGTHAYNGYNIGNEDYQKLISKLDVEKTAPNGYFILVILTAAVSLIMQIVMSKAQKAQMELQTVDGQGAATQRVMKWMMPAMMAIFAFLYTAAFSIYIILSSVISILTTYLINFIVDRKLKKRKQIVDESEQKIIRGRVYTPKEEPKKEEKKEKKNKNDKFAHSNGGDFLTGPAKRNKNRR